MDFMHDSLSDGVIPRETDKKSGLRKITHA
jgi:hypothetical protein